MADTDRLLRLPEVMARTSMPRSSIYELARQGRFPKPLKINKRASAWRESEIAAWIDSLSPARVDEDANDAA